MKLPHLIVLVLAFVAAPALADEVFIESFESTSVGSFPAGWTQRFGSPGSHGEAVSDSAVREGARAFRNVGNPFWASEVYTTQMFIPPTSGTVTLSASVQFSSTSTNPLDECDNADITYYWSDNRVSLGFRRTQSDPVGVFYVKGTSHEVVPDRWYSLRAIIDIGADTYDLYVDGVLALNDAPVGDIAPDERLNRLAIHTGCVDKGDIVAYFDEIQLVGTERPCDADFDEDGAVTVFDLLELLSRWGSCP